MQVIVNFKICSNSVAVSLETATPHPVVWERFFVVRLGLWVISSTLPMKSVISRVKKHKFIHRKLKWGLEGLLKCFSQKRPPLKVMRSTICTNLTSVMLVVAVIFYKVMFLFEDWQHVILEARNLCGNWVVSLMSFLLHAHINWSLFRSIWLWHKTVGYLLNTLCIDLILLQYICYTELVLCWH